MFWTFIFEISDSSPLHFNFIWSLLHFIDNCDRTTCKKCTRCPHGCDLGSSIWRKKQPTAALNTSTSSLLEAIIHRSVFPLSSWFCTELWFLSNSDGRLEAAADATVHGVFLTVELSDNWIDPGEMYGVEEECTYSSVLYHRITILR